jgi:hypothetical protein
VSHQHAHWSPFQSAYALPTSSHAKTVNVAAAPAGFARGILSCVGLTITVRALAFPAMHLVSCRLVRRCSELQGPERTTVVTDQMPYDPLHRATPQTKPREEIFAWAFVKDVRTFTGSLRAVDDEQWEVVYLADGNLYDTQVFAARPLAENDLARTRYALEAAGWCLSRLAEAPETGN